MFKKKLLLILVAIFLVEIGYAQDSFQELKLSDLSSFKPQSGNWMVVGDVSMDRNMDIHHQPEKAPVENNKKKKKKNKGEAEVKIKSPVNYQSGTGVLLNINSEEKKDNIVTNWEHGDIELELEVMLPKGSNSGIYLQGAYEVQLLDSWGVEKPGFSDIGGIYRNWENDPDKAYHGKAPLLNAAKAPGLWQKFKIAFQAPRFNAQGEKIQNARFIYVDLNGVRIHENVEVYKMTGGSILKAESPKGPIMIQGDHGPVALRNIQYKLMKESEVTVSDIDYKVFYGTFKSEKDFATLKPEFSGKTDLLTWEVANKENDFAIKFSGKLNIPEDGDYYLNQATWNDFSMSVDGNTVINYGEGKSKAVSLSKGTHSFEVVFFKSVSWYRPFLGVFIKTSDTYPKALHTFNSLPPAVGTPSPIYVETGNQPKLHMAFFDYKGNRGQRLTHTIAVGEPSGLNYIFDLKSGSVVCSWRGGFIDATPMWHDRGDGSFRPTGVIQYLTNQPSLAYLSDSTANFPTTSESDFIGKGYILDKDGRPTFRYIYKGVTVLDKSVSLDGQKILQREVKFEGETNNSFYYRLAAGKKINVLEDGSYAIDDKQYYVEVKSAQKPFIRNSNGMQELVIKASGTINYAVIW